MHRVTQKFYKIYAFEDSDDALSVFLQNLIEIYDEFDKATKNRMKLWISTSNLLTPKKYFHSFLNEICLNHRVASHL